MGITEEEAEYIAGALAKIVVSRKETARMERAAKQLEKHGPWIGFLLALGAIYGPRLFVLWKAMQAQKAQRNRKPVVVSIAQPAEEKPDSAVN